MGDVGWCREDGPLDDPRDASTPGDAGDCTPGDALDGETTPGVAGTDAEYRCRDLLAVEDEDCMSQIADNGANATHHRQTQWNQVPRDHEKTYTESSRLTGREEAAGLNGGFE